jgi:hypothetical protein
MPDRGATEIIAALREKVTEGGDALLDELVTELGLGYWPQETWECALGIFGGQLYNRSSRTFKALDRRIRHCLRTWDEQHGPLNPDQQAYADACLASSLRKSAREAGTRKNLWPYCQAGLGRLVHHDRVQDGFVKRGNWVSMQKEIEEALGDSA